MDDRIEKLLLEFSIKPTPETVSVLEKFLEERPDYDISHLKNDFKKIVSIKATCKQTIKH